MGRCDMLLLQQTYITDYNSNELDIIAEGNIAVSFIPAKQCTNLTVGRQSVGLAIFWRSFNNSTCKTILYTDRILSLTLETNYFK